VLFKASPNAVVGILLVSGNTLAIRAVCHGMECTDDGRCSMIRKLKSGQYRLYSRKKDARTGRRRNLGTFASLAAAKRHERAIQYFKRA
jgi:hypothetical protein